MRRPQLPIEIRPPMGGQLITAPAPDAAGAENYSLKRDWRRLDDCEIRSEGYNYFRPNIASVTVPTQTKQVLGGTGGANLGSQPLFADDDIILKHEVKRPNGDKCVIVGTRTTLYRFFSQTGGGYYDPATYYDSDYFEDNPGEWLVIGTGFSANGKRWQAVDINGYVVLNNQVDVPLAYRVEWTEVKPLYELRELGVASVGTIFELESYLIAANIRQIKDEDLQGVFGLLDSGDVTGSQAGGVSSSDLQIVGTVAAGTTVVTATGNIFQAGHVGKTIRFVNQFTATITQFFGATSVGLDAAPDADVSGLAFIVTRPLISGGTGYVNGTNCRADWVVGQTPPFLGGLTMAGQYYVLFGATPAYPNGWCSGIASVTDFANVVLVKSAPTAITGTPFMVVPSEYLLTLSAGTFQFTDSMAGEQIFYGYKKRRILGVIDGTHALTSTDYPLSNGRLSITNPAAYSPYSGSTDGYGFRVLWGLPTKPERFGSTVDCAIEAGDNRVTLDWPLKSLSAGDEVIVLGADVNGGDLLSTIKFIAGTTVLLADIASTTVRKIGPVAAVSLKNTVTAATLTRSGTTATFTATAPHNLTSGLNVTVRGASLAPYNGTFLITVTGPTTFTYGMLSDPGGSSTGAPTGTSTVALFTTTDPHGLKAGQLVTIAGAKQPAYNGAFNVGTVPDSRSFTYTMLSDPGVDASAAVDGISASADGGTLMLADSITNQDRFADLEDDGSGILTIRKLKGIGVVFRETSIFLMEDSGQVSPPFVFDLIYGGSKGGDRAGALAFPEAVGNVLDDYLVYPGENDFWRFDLVTRSPKVFTPLHHCRDTFFDVVERGDDVFSADNEVTRELWFSFPDADGDDLVLRLDYLFDTVSSSSTRVTAACTVNRPRCDGVNLDEKWFGMALGGIVGYYGLTSAKPIESNNLAASQSGTVVTASGSIFKPEHVGRTIVYALTGGVTLSAHIVDYVNGTTVLAEPSQTVSSRGFAIVPQNWSRFGVDYASEIDAVEIHFGMASREKRLKSYGIQLAEDYIGGASGQAAETGVVLNVPELVPGKWYRMGRVRVSNVQVLMSYDAMAPDPLDPFNVNAALGSQATQVPIPAGTGYEVDAEKGLVRLVLADPGVTPDSGQLEVTFDCAAIADRLSVEMWGGLSMAKGMSRLFARQLTDLESGFVIKTCYAKYLYQDRIIINGAHNSARLAVRAFEIVRMDGSQIGRQSR